MNFSLTPAEARAIGFFLLFILAAVFGGAVAFVKGLDLSENAPVRTRFWPELGRKLFIAAFVGFVMYAITQTYGPQPPLVWVVAGLSGVFASEVLDLLWVIGKDKALGFFRVPPPARGETD